MPPPATAGPVPPRFRAHRAKAATQLRPRKPCRPTRRRASNSAVPSIRARTHSGCHACSIGTALEVKKGIMRCATAMNTTTTQPQMPLSTKPRAAACASSRTAMPIPARHTHPQASAPAIAFACKRSGASLACTMRQKRNVIAVSPVTANASPAKAISTCRWVPSNHSSQPPAWASSDALTWPALGAGMPSQRGPAVNRNPAKNNGMKPNVITTEWASDGGTA